MLRHSFIIGSGDASYSQCYSTVRPQANRRTQIPPRPPDLRTMRRHSRSSDRRFRHIQLPSVFDALRDFLKFKILPFRHTLGKGDFQPIASTRRAIDIDMAFQDCTSAAWTHSPGNKTLSSVSALQQMLCPPIEQLPDDAPVQSK